MEAGAAAERSRWLGPPNDGAARSAVALLIHGLNLRPTRLLQIANMLSAEGVACLKLALNGHGSPDDAAGAERDMREGASLESFKSVSHAQWLAEARAAHALARIRAEELGVPLILVGFSLGATLGAELANQPGPAPRFDGMILFAPAFRVHWYTRLLRLLWPFPRLTLKSFSPRRYAANPATPIAAYNALFRSMAALPDRPEQQRVTNALIFIDPKDELVSYRALRTLCESQASSS
jgi:alpha-beta hydrolase superfamily lysophospholipase